LYYDLTNPDNLQTTITWNNASSVASIVDNQSTPYSLVAGTDYSVSSYTLQLNNSYLSGVLTTAGQEIELEVSFNMGNPSLLTVIAIESPASDAQINPQNATYDLYQPHNVETTITWNDATVVSGIVDDQTIPQSLVENTDYAVSGNVLTIFSSWLSSHLLAVNDEAVLTISFDFGQDAVFTITAISTDGIGKFSSCFSVYPNPSNGQFVIETDNNWTMMVYDITGRIVASQQITKGSNDINLLGQPSGLYMVRLFNKEQTQTIRIVIE